MFLKTFEHQQITNILGLVKVFSAYVLFYYFCALVCCLMLWHLDYWFPSIFCNYSCINELILQVWKKFHSGNYPCMQSLPKMKLSDYYTYMEDGGQSWKKTWSSDLSVSVNCLTCFVLLYHKLIKHIWIPKPSVNTKWHSTRKYLKMGAKTSSPYVLSGVPLSPGF